MKKTLILALALTMVASLSFAANARFVQPNATFTTGSPATTNNDDTCDIAVVPAATLLLPHFEVDFANGPGGGPNTNFSITNTSHIPQIAHVTVWTDWSFPVLDFNIFLTGYDVQPVSLYNIIGRGELPATTATASRGALSANPNPNWSGAAVGACTGLPATLPGFLVAEIQGALTEGTYFDCLGQVGSDDHGPNAVGYVTIDVANTCSQSLPTDPAYYSQEILYDNTLIGEYYRIDPRADTGNFAGGNPMVHIRAIPEGGAAGSAAIVNFPFTFYDRYTLGNLADAANKIDRRQPLPSNFAARFIYTDTDFQTHYAIWREGELGGADTIACLDLTGNAFIPIADIVRFDEHENPTFFPGGGCQYSPCTTPEFTLPETSAHSVNDTTVFPPDSTASADAGGWMYLNMSHNQSDPTVVPDYSVVRQTGGTHAGRSQNWVIVQMTAFGRYGVDFDAAYLENGCSVLRPDVVDGVQEVINWGATGNVTP